LTVEKKREMIKLIDSKVSSARKCELLGMSRSTLYYNSQRSEKAKAFEHRVLRAMDEIYTEQSTLGRKGICDALEENYNIYVNEKRVRRLMNVLNIKAVKPRRNKTTTASSKEHLKYPYLLKDMDITERDQVWCADITYIPLHRGNAYLVAVMDWATRCILSWELSNTMTANFCVDALEKALESGRRPKIFNTDQGTQFTSKAFTGVLIREGISISMDGAGRAFDNIMIERLWRTVKYEDVYLRDYQTQAEARCGLNKYITYYNHCRRHQSLNKTTPARFYGLTLTDRDRKALALRKASARIERDLREIKQDVGVPHRADVYGIPVALRAPSIP